MKNNLFEKFRVLLLCLLVAVGLAACSNPRGQDGKTKVDQVIALEEVTLNKDQVNISEISDQQSQRRIRKFKRRDNHYPTNKLG